MTTAARRASSLMDELLPDYDFRASYQARISAPAPLVYQRLLVCDLYAAPIVRLLITLRTGKRIPRNRPPAHLRHWFDGSGFVVLAEAADEELVIGVAGKFWRPDGGRCLDLSPGDFARFSRPGCAKVAMNFRLRPESPRSTVLSTETRIQCCDWAAWWRFRLYWTVVALFSGLIRLAILWQVKAESEAAVEGTRKERVA